MSGPSAPGVLTRRGFLSSGARLGLVLGAPGLVRAAAAPVDTLNVAVIGCGEQGRVLINAALGLPGIRFRAICDIWEYHRLYAERLLAKFGHAVRSFEDHREMLATVSDLDAVIVATPDFMHAEHTNAALRAGRHVYCEKVMAHSIEAARSMVRTARETGRLLQVGHQRRSNPRYLHARDRLLREARLLGRLTVVSGQWHRAVSRDLGFPARQAIPAATLARHGYGSMHELRNWRWFRKYSGGPVADLGAHQIDVYNWMLGANPQSVMASGGVDYYRGREWYDTAFAVYEFPLEEGTVRAAYQVLTTTSAGGGYHEYFMGDEGSLKISENPRLTRVYREAHAPEWDLLAAKGYLAPAGGDERGGASAKGAVDVRETADLGAWEIPVVLNQPIHQPHLENFFAAIRHGTPLACPGEAAFATTVTVLRVNEAIAAARKLAFQSSDFLA